MKVHSKCGSGRPAVMTAISLAVVVTTFVAGAGIIPVSAAVAQLAAGETMSGTGALPPAKPEPKTAEIRQPSGIEAIETRAAGTRNPTVIRKAPAPGPRPVAPAAAPAPADPDGWKSAKASWYGPGFYGNTMAGGGTLQPDSMVVAHRTMRFGTVIEFSYNGRTATAVVMDRGPHVAGRVFDLGPGTAQALGFSGVGTVQYRIVSQ